MVVAVAAAEVGVVADTWVAVVAAEVGVVDTEQ